MFGGGALDWWGLGGPSHIQCIMGVHNNVNIFNMIKFHLVVFLQMFYVANITTYKTLKLYA